MLKKIEYNTFDVVLKDLVLFFSSVLFVLLLSTYTLASEYNVKEIVTEGRAVIIDGNKKLAKKRKKVLGEEYVQKNLDNADDFSLPFQKIIVLDWS